MVWGHFLLIHSTMGWVLQLDSGPEHTAEQ